jgi:hypothetical protein
MATHNMVSLNYVREQPYRLDESETPVAVIHSHYLDQISDLGYYKSEIQLSAESTVPKMPRQRLDVTLSLLDIVGILNTQIGKVYM